MDGFRAVLIVQALLGAFDTVWYHEVHLGLAGRPACAREVRLHGLRALTYAGLFVAVATTHFRGPWVLLYGLPLAAELVLTLLDFAEEARSRGPGLFPAGERVTHLVMAAVHGGLWVLLLRSAADPAGCALAEPTVAGGFLVLAALGALGSGIRDLWAAGLQ